MKKSKVKKIFCLLLLLFCLPNITQAASTSTLPTQIQTEKMVREYFAGNPTMIDIAQCESRFRQYNSNGTPLIGSGLYLGVFQINYKIHTAKALAMNMDIKTLEGNLAYAKYLFNQLGTQPWAGCVKNSVSPTSISLTKNLKLGDNNSQVKILQQLLNQSGYLIAETGPGSLGYETNYFGAMTKKAVQKFQCEKKIICHGSENTTGFGLVGPLTKKILFTSGNNK